MTTFNNRKAAGRALAEVLVSRNNPDPVVLALPRGGVPVALEIARSLKAPLDLIMVRKIGLPYQPELAVAAVVNGDNPELVVNEDIAALAKLDKEEIDRLAKSQLAEIKRRRRIYLKDRAQVTLEGRTAIVVDDGIATGATVRASLKAVRRRKPAKLVLAVPVAPADTLEVLRAEVDDLICIEIPEFFYAIGNHYIDFSQVPDEEVERLLDEADQMLKGKSASESKLGE
jgi:putative phosphoribosyl transferase